jgi:hypothetical protein
MDRDYDPWFLSLTMGLGHLGQFLHLNIPHSSKVGIYCVAIMYFISANSKANSVSVRSIQYDHMN